MSVEKTYNRYAAVYDTLFGLILQHGRNKLAKLISKESGEKLLEIGVGSGLMLSLYPCKLSITGIDISQGMLLKARKRALQLHGRDITLLHVDGEYSRLPDGKFDHVVLPYVYSVTPDPDHMMMECFRLCSPGGQIWILNHFSGHGNIWDILGWLVKPFSDFVGFRSDFSYDEYVANKSWKIESIHSVNLMGLSRIVQIRKSIEQDV